MLNDTDWITELKEKRLAYGASKNKLAVAAGMGMGVVLMCALQVGKEADTRLEEIERSNGK